MLFRSILIREVLPALLGYLALVLAAVILDFVLHGAGLAAIGVYLGPIGTATLGLSFLYSLRKRKHISFGTPKGLLQLHEVLTWVGSLMILVHAGWRVNALLPWLAILAMLVVMASGYTGSVLVKRATETLKQRTPVEAGGREPSVLDAVTLDIMKQWRSVHLPINAVFLALTLIHVGAVLAFRYW